MSLTVATTSRVGQNATNEDWKSACLSMKQSYLDDRFRLLFEMVRHKSDATSEPRRSVLMNRLLRRCVFDCEHSNWENYPEPSSSSFTTPTFVVPFTVNTPNHLSHQVERCITNTEPTVCEDDSTSSSGIAVVKHEPLEIEFGETPETSPGLVVDEPMNVFDSFDVGFVVSAKDKLGDALANTPHGKKLSKLKKCVICGSKLGSSLAAVAQHMQNHGRIPAGSQQCRYCDYSTDSRIAAHEKVHGVESHRLKNCLICGCQLSNQEHAESHMKNHGRNPPGKHQCRYCDFSCDFQLARHEKLHAEYTPLPAPPAKCTICGCAFANASHAESHMQHHGSNPPGKQQCRYCDYSNDSNIAPHEKIHADYTPVDTDTRKKCQICGSVVGNNERAEHHMRNHGRNPPGEQQCRYCDYSSDANIAPHEKIHAEYTPMLVHPNTCSICGCMLGNAANAASHIKNHGRNPPGKQQCRYCDYSTDSHIAAHEKIHAEYKSLPEVDYRRKCPICGCIFGSVESSVTHMGNHGRNPPGKYQCRYCDYSNDSTLGAHEKVHAEYTPLPDVDARKKCSICGSILSNAVNAESHMNNHGRYPPGKHQCRYCDYSNESTIGGHEKVHAEYTPLPDVDARKKCLICGSILGNAVRAESHMNNHCRDPPGKYQCRYCDYSNDSTIGGHEKVHAEYTPLPEVDTRSKCAICGCIFGGVESSVTHMGNHGRNPPGKYQCRYCDFSNDSSIAGHEKVHGLYPSPSRSPTPSSGELALAAVEKHE